MPAKCTTPPTTEPLTLAEAKAHLKEIVTNADVDAEINMSIKAVRELCENDCRRAFMKQSWQISLDQFPRPQWNYASAAWYGPQWDVSPGPLITVLPEGSTGYEIYLPYPPLLTVDSINYIDGNGVAQTLNPLTDIIVDSISEPARIVPSFGVTWPQTQKQINAMTIGFSCGYNTDPADASLVPACAKQWMKAMLGTVHEMRQGEFAAYRETLLVPAHVDRLLDPIRIRRY